ncbi:hypothetical protein JRI60_39605 [Archangium violaceum]|uniref:hypothetical protein n=1 Tax=Archangium violaceum TaxID=83451 RepID=UPI0019508243|nr:hypothetical protein [Archangium violaceum]QRN95139.1 hypothetical protein JRI60_39605 [Archangium violaceum]
MTTNTRAWRWGPLLAVTVGALSSLHCIELPTKSFSCSTDEDCEGLKGPAGESFVCVNGGWCASPEQSDAGVPSDAGTDGGICPQSSTPASCSTSNWCWDNPLSEGRTLITVRGRSATDVWAVGDRGVALHWDGNCWARMPPGNTQPLRAAWPAAGKTWWFAGNGGTLFKWDGSTWASQTLAEQLIIHDIEGTSDTSAVAVGQSGSIYTFNGQQWSAQSWDAGSAPPDLLAVWPVSNTEAWAVGRGGTLARGVDGRWSIVSRSGPGSVDLMAIAAGADAGTAHAVGRGVLVTYSNSTWSPSSYATSSTPLNGVWTSGGVTRIVGPASNIHVLGRSATEPSGTPQVLNSIWGNNEALWAVGVSGTIVRRGTTQWSEVPGGVTRALNGFWGTDELNLWAAGDNDLLMRRENNLWSPVTPPEQGTFRAIWGSGELLVVATSGGKLHAFKNGQWAQEAGGNTSVNALWGTGSSPVWAVGDNGLVWRRNADGTWTDEGKLGTDRMNAVWGSSPTDVWAVGNGGVILHRDSAGWSRQKLATATDLFGVWGSSPSDVWAVGNGGAIYHYDGRAWTTTPTQVGSQIFRAIAGRSGDSVWAVGDNGAIAFWNGSGWTAQVSGVDESLRAVWVTPGTVWVGGTNGTVLRLKP